MVNNGILNLKLLNESIWIIQLQMKWEKDQERRGGKDLKIGGCGLFKGIVKHSRVRTE